MEQETFNCPVPLADACNIYGDRQAGQINFVFLTKDLRLTGTEVRPVKRPRARPFPISAASARSPAMVGVTLTETDARRLWVSFGEMRGATKEKQ